MHRNHQSPKKGIDFNYRQGPVPLVWTGLVWSGSIMCSKAFGKQNIQTAWRESGS